MPVSCGRDTYPILCCDCVVGHPRAGSMGASERFSCTLEI